jgi:hypothetical protein
MPENWLYLAVGAAVVAFFRPFLWTVLLAGSLWVGYRFLPDRFGRRLFGHYWKKPSQGMLE